MKFLFYISKKYSIPIVEPILKYLKNTKHILPLFVSKKVAVSLPGTWEKFDIFIDINKAVLFSPDFVLVPGNFVHYRISEIKVQLFHGLGVEKKSHFKIRHFFDVYCTSGPFVSSVFYQLQKKYKYFLVKETGWAKTDHIINFNTDNLKERYKIPKDY